MRAQRLALPLLLLLLASPAALLGATTRVVETEQGPVRGVLDEQGDVAVFRGLPYAAPPVGELRWRAPQPPASWSGVRDADTDGFVCPQSPRRGLEADRMSEDCLTLNVWTPAEQLEREEPLPVMVWIHGGAFRSGTGSSPATDGANFAREGVVLVAINYRLGALGFFSHPALRAETDEPGVNYGLLDMSAALDWVQGNVAAFGGDPQRVTVFGMSAGGMAVQMLMVSPSSKGLFQGAIAMSGYGTWPRPRTGEERFGHPTAEQLGVSIVARGAQLDADAAAALSAEELRELEPEQLLAGVVSLHLPIVDGEVLPDEPATLFAAGRQHDVPFVTGGTSYDGAIMPMARIPHAPYLESLGDDLPAFRELYAADFAVSDAQGASRLFGDARYLIAARVLAREMRTVSSPGFLYFYHHVPLAKRHEWIGTPHGTEVAPMFGNFLGPATPDDPETRRAGELMRRAWIGFARTGAPGGEGLPEWPRHDAADDRWMVLGPAPVVRRAVLRARLDLIESRYRERLGER